MATTIQKPKRDRISIDLAPSDRALLLHLEAALEDRTGTKLSPAQILLATFRRHGIQFREDLLQGRGGDIK
jgi:hypothetical protein